MEEQTIAIVSFNGALKREVMKVKQQLMKVDALSEFRIDLEVSGRVHDGDVKIEYKLSGGTYASDMVSGNELSAVTEEFLRRKGWKERHQPLLLTVSEQNRANPDMPFDKGQGQDNSKGEGDETAL